MPSLTLAEARARAAQLSDVAYDLELAPSGAGAWTFEATPPVPVDLVVVCAGPWHSRTFEHAGLPMGWHARRSLAAELDRDLDQLRRVTERCFDHYTAMFDEPFPFAQYHQVFVPGLNWGAMANPGCVTFRDELLPRGEVSDVDRQTRTMVIAHEMAHMWFGDLVTQTWWEDLWLNESFAEYMGFRVSADAVGHAGTWVGFQVTHKVRALTADRRRSTHAVAPRPEEVPDVDTAGTNFDSISYVKGASALRQLVTWLGDDPFLAGVNAHLTRHRFGNATLADLVGALDAASSRDVTAWAEVWLRRSGHDTIRVERDGGVPVLVRDGVRPHRFLVTAYDDALVEVAAPLFERYLAAAPRLARRGPAYAQVVGAASTTFLLAPAQVEQLRAALAGEVPTVLRRAWEDALDDRT